jgi:hypothetical protein
MRKVYSHSKREVLAKCLTQYFYEYYAASAAPAPQASQLGLFDRQSPGRVGSIERGRAEAAGRLKDLTNVYMLAGEILHALIATYLKGSRWGRQWFLKAAGERFDRSVVYSREPARNAAMESEPYPPPMLLEFYYGDPEAETIAAAARSRLLTALGNFFDVPAISGLTALMLGGQEVLVEQRIGGLTKAGEFGIQGTVDFACVGPSGVRIVDWKMGGSVGDQDSLQLSLYGKWAVAKFQVAPTDVIVQRVFLGDGVVEQERRLDARIMRRGEARLLQDVELMEELDRYGRAGIEEAFSPCEKEKVCRQCKFQEICPATRSALGSRQTSGSRPAAVTAS